MSGNLRESALLPQDLDREYPVIARGDGCYLIDSEGKSQSSQSDPGQFTTNTTTIIMIR